MRSRWCADSGGIEILGQWFIVVWTRKRTRALVHPCSFIVIGRPLHSNLLRELGLWRDQIDHFGSGDVVVAV